MLLFESLHKANPCSIATGTVHFAPAVNGNVPDAKLAGMADQAMAFCFRFHLQSENKGVAQPFFPISGTLNSINTGLNE